MYEPLVVARALARNFNQPGGAARRVLEGIDALILPGERIALTGPSGSGKSTLLNLLAGLDRPSAGQVEWPALETWAAPQGPRPRGIAQVFQFASLLPALDVLENVCLPRQLEAHPPALPALRVEGLQRLAAFGLEALAHKLPEELSGGQAHRVAMVRALMAQPRLILADEPTGQLDHATARQFLDVLLAQAEAADIALLVATHDTEVAARLPRQWRLARGRLQDAREATTEDSITYTKDAS